MEKAWAIAALGGHKDAERWCGITRQAVAQWTGPRLKAWTRDRILAGILRREYALARGITPEQWFENTRSEERYEAELLEVIDTAGVLSILRVKTNGEQLVIDLPTVKHHPPRNLPATAETIAG